MSHYACFNFVTLGVLVTFAVLVISGLWLINTLQW